jgi:type 1 glutamine amidotransferase/sugar phosphate isomerase/epimerase
MKKRTQDIAMATLILVLLGAQAAKPQAPAAGRTGGGGRGRPAVPSVSVRPSDMRMFRTAAAQVLGWSVGIASSAFPQLTFSDAVAKADALGFGSVQGSSSQKVSAAIPKNLDENLSPEEIAAVKNRLAELRLRMPSYRVPSLSGNEASLRKQLELAKGLGVETVVCDAAPASLIEIDKLAGEIGVNIAIDGGHDPKSMLNAVEGRSKRIGLSIDTGAWLQAGVKPMDALPEVKDRLMVLNLRDRSALGAGGREVTLGDGAAELGAFLRAANRMGVKPLILTIKPAGAGDTYADLAKSAEGAEKAFQLAIGDRVNEISKNTAITLPDKLPQEISAAIDAATPRQAPVRPKKARRLLILDENLFAYIHATIPHGNLALNLMGKYTGAYEPIFSNDLDNLKYPKIKEFDAVFLNSAGGMIFVDPEVRDGLTRFIREGGGLAGIHAASYASLEWPEFTELIGAGDGPHRVEKVTLKLDDPGSPLLTPFEGRGFVYVDEFYHFPPTGPYSRENLHILFSIDAQRTDLRPWPIRPDNDYGLSWIKSYGNGRVFYSELGHTPTLFMTPALSEFVLRGIQFALGDLEADTTPSAKLAITK